MNYAELVAAITNFTQDNDAEFLAEIPNIISRAENRLLRDLDLELMEDFVEDALTTGSRSLAMPDDVVMTTSLWYRLVPPATPPEEGDPPAPSASRHYPVDERGYDYCLDYAPDEILDVGPPRYYAEFQSAAEPEQPPEPLNITVLDVESLENFFSDQQLLFQLGGPSGIEEDLDSNPPFALTPPSFGDLYSGWDGIEPLLPEETWYPDVWFGIGVTDETDTWNVLVLLEGDQEPDSWSVDVTGDLTNEGGAGSLGAGTWYGRSGIGYEASVGLNLNGDYDSVFVGTVTVTATVGSQTYVATATVWYKGVLF